MTNHLKGLLMTFIGVIILSPDSVLIRLADADSWTVLFWRGLLMSIGVTILLLFTYRSKTINEFKKVGDLITKVVAGLSKNKEDNINLQK